MRRKRCLIARTAITLALTLTSIAAAQYERVEIADGVYSFGDGGYFSMFVVTNNGVIATDPVNPTYAAAMLQSIGEVTAQPVRFVIYSHDHWDHIRGGQVFVDAGATIISHADAQASILESPHPEVVVPQLTWSGSQRDITFGGTRLELYHFGESHGRGMTILLLPDERVVFTADLVKPQTLLFGILPDYSPENLIRTLGELDALPFDTIMMGHKDHVAPHSIVGEQRQYFIDLQAAVRTALDAGQNPAAIPDTIELPQYSDWESYDEYLSLNAWRVVMENWMGW